ncbi:MAG: hypothetical protein JXB03_00275 [Spirochaetales bacterium]|nr:hypothetical protein [Spirochaetales bacterium]
MENKMNGKGTPMREFYLRYQAERSFRRVRMEMTVSRILPRKLQGLFRKKSREGCADCLRTKGGDTYLPLNAVRGIVYRDGSTGPIPVPCRNLETLWTMLWIADDMDHIPEIRITRTPEGWYLSDNPASVIAYLLMKEKGAPLFRIEVPHEKRSTYCRLHDFTPVKPQEQVASAG